MFLFAQLLDLFSGLWAFFLHVTGGGSFPKALPAAQERKYLEELSRGSPTARQALIEHNLRLVSHIVGKYARMGLGDDLFSIGCIGLIKAADTFSPEKKIRFSSYAAKCVQNEILMVLRAGKKSARDVSLSDPIESDRDGNPLTVGDLIADDQDLPALIDRRLDAEKLAALVAGLLVRMDMTRITLYIILCVVLVQPNLEQGVLFLLQRAVDPSEKVAI